MSCRECDVAARAGRRSHDDEPVIGDLHCTAHAQPCQVNGVAIAPRRGDLELCGYARQQVLAPERGDELDADRQSARRLPGRQADRRLSGDAERCREAPDAFESRQDLQRVGGWRQ